MQTYPKSSSNSLENFIFQTTETGPGVFLDTSYVPATASSPGTAGQLTADSNYLYFCRATNDWVRVALAQW